MSDMGTVKDNFPVIDITHKPKRMQGDSFKEPVKQEISEDVRRKEITELGTVTIERAIKFYETNAHGEYRVLYLQTAKWLREHLNKSVTL